MRRCAALALLLLIAPPGRAGDSRPAFLREVTFEQRLDEQVPLDLEFRNEAGQTVKLGDYFGKPVVLVLAYYRCPMLCTQVLNGLLDSMRGVPFNVGDQFEVVTVSFDPREQPELAAAKKTHYVDSYGRAGAADGWHFLTGRRDSIDKLTASVGFHYAYDGRQDQFAHASGIVVLTPHGKIARYFYGIDFPSRDLRLALVEASAGKIGTPVDRVLLLCYHYDPAVGRYTTAVMGLVRLGGGVTLVVFGIFLIRAWRQERRRHNMAGSTGASC